MDALVPLGGARHRRGISATSDSGEWMKRCTTLAKGRAFRDKTGTKRKRSVRTPQLPDEIVWEIMLRLPVKSLLRFRSVCNAWRAIISDPVFIHAQLRCSASKWEQDPSFIISPHTLDSDVIPGEVWPPNFSNHIHFYQWKQGASVAKFMHAKDFVSEFRRVRPFAHCDGLVLAPTDTRLYLFNPATRDAITLPDSDRNNLRQAIRACYCAGLGLDPSTGKYKVVQAFYRSVDPYTNIPDMGMEVFTVGGFRCDTWREIMDDPPYPVKRFHTGLTVNGFLFWEIDKRHLKQPPRGILRLSLKDEEFSITGLPDSLDPLLDDAFILDVLHGRELCLTAHTSETIPANLTIWTMSIGDGGLNSKWERRYSIHVSDLLRPMVLLPGSSGIILWDGDTFYRYELTSSELTTLCEMDRIRYQGRRARKWKNLFGFNAWPYTESLVRITKQPFIPSAERGRGLFAVLGAELRMALRYLPER